MVESTPPQPSKPPAPRTRNPVVYPGQGPRSGTAMPSLAKPQRAEIEPKIQEQVGRPANEDPTQIPAAPSPESSTASTQTPIPPRRVRALPVPTDEDGEATPSPAIAAQPSPAPSNRALPKEARLEDAKTVYVVSDIVDALRADAGYEPLPRDPHRPARTKRGSLWSRLLGWFKALR